MPSIYKYTAKKHASQFFVWIEYVRLSQEAYHQGLDQAKGQGWSP